MKGVVFKAEVTKNFNCLEKLCIMMWQHVRLFGVHVTLLFINSKICVLKQWFKGQKMSVYWVWTSFY